MSQKSSQWLNTRRTYTRAEREPEQDRERPEPRAEERVREQPLQQEVGARQQGRVGQVVGAQARAFGEQQDNGESHERDIASASPSELRGRQNGLRHASTSQIARATVSETTLTMRRVTEYKPMKAPPPSAVR